MLMVLSWLVGIVVLVCWIMEVVTAFQKGDGPLLGILSIVCCCTLGGLIIGWIKCKEWGIQTLMLVCTIAFVSNLSLSVLQHEQMLKMFSGAE